MQLLYSSGLSASQFVTLSLLLKPTSQASNNHGGQEVNTGIDMVEPILVASPIASVSLVQSLDSVKELHSYLTDVLKARSPQKSDSSVALDFLREDEVKLIENSIQVFRPRGTAGLGLHYRLVRAGSDNTTIAKLISLILSSSKNGSGFTKIDPSVGIYGVVVCVGITGSSYAHCASFVQYSVAQRISDSLSLLCSTKITDATTAKAILHTYLLLDAEHRKNNEMMHAPNLLIVPEPNESDSTGVRNLLSPIGIFSPIAGIGKTQRSAMPSIRGVTYGGAVSMTGDNGGAHQDEVGFPLSLELGSADAARILTERLHILSVAENDSKLRKYDTSGAERKANLDLVGGGKSRFRRLRKGGETRDADFDNFDYKGPINETVKKSAVASFKAIPALAPAPEGSNKLALKSSRKDTTTKRGNNASSRRLISQNSDRLLDDEVINQQQSHISKISSNFDSLSGNHDEKRKRKSRRKLDDEHSQDASSVSSEPRMTVNVALNEDLTCSYKLSQLSSCTVEGFLQVSVKSSSRPGSMPFLLYIRDELGHIEAVSENKKVAQDVTDSLTRNDNARFKYIVNVPKFESYCAVVKYKCVGDLRPVPLRVQTKVKTEGSICRVALQISSNPNNAANLTELTILMGVPDNVRGESLVTQPPGGVWDKEKSSVVWCVSELGCGEKFQLQARFEILRSDMPSSELNFPVLVRCECLFAQLSDVEVEVTEFDDKPADITTKVARRYRLSHREKHS